APAPSRGWRASFRCAYGHTTEPFRCPVDATEAAAGSPSIRWLRATTGKASGVDFACRSSSQGFTDVGYDASAWRRAVHHLRIPGLACVSIDKAPDHGRLQPR